MGVDNESMTDIESRINAYDIAEAETLSICVDDNIICFTVKLWNNEVVEYRFTDWLYNMFTSAIYYELSRVSLVYRSPLVIRLANEFMQGEQSINQAIENYVEIQIWDIETRDQPAFIVVASEVEITEINVQ